MSKARAAEVWAKLERWLIEHCGLPDGRMLERERPQLIRSIGSSMRGGDIQREEKAQRQSQAQRKAPRQSQGKGRIRPTVLGSDRAGLVVNESRPGETGRPPVSLDTIHDQAWAAMIERSCSRRMGYDGDDEVDYAGSR